LEREFRLCYHVPGFSLNDIRNTSVRELDWFHSRLIQELRDKEEAHSVEKKDSIYD